MLVEFFRGAECIKRSNEGFGAMTRYARVSKAKTIYMDMLSNGGASISIHYANGIIGWMNVPDYIPFMDKIYRAQNLYGARYFRQRWVDATPEEARRLGSSLKLHIIVNTRLASPSARERSRLMQRTRRTRGIVTRAHAMRDWCIKASKRTLPIKRRYV